MRGLGLWAKVAHARVRKDPLGNWRHVLGADFEAVRPYLRMCVGEFSRNLICPETGQLMLVRMARGRRIAHTDPSCEGSMHEIWDVPDADVQLWRLDERALASAVAGALGLARAEGLAGALGALGAAVMEIGVCRRGSGRRRVMLCLAGDVERAVPAVCGIGEGDGVGCVLVAGWFAGVRDLLRMKGAAELLMGECLRIEDGWICGDCGGACGSVGRGQLAAASGGMRDLSVREAVAHFDGRLEKVGREVVGEIGGRLDRVGNDMAGRIERVEQMRRTDVERVRQQRETIGDMAQGVDKFLAGLQGRLNKADQRLVFELIDKCDDDGLHRPRSYSEIGKRLGGVSKQAVGTKVRNLFKRHPAVKDYVQETRKPEKPITFSEMSPSARRKTGIDSSYDHSVS